MGSVSFGFRFRACVLSEVEIFLQITITVLVGSVELAQAMIPRAHALARGGG